MKAAGMGRFEWGIVLTSIFVLSAALQLCNAGETSRFLRRLAYTPDLPADHPLFAVPKGYNAPQQVHITQGDYDGKAVIVSWVTPSELGATLVYYGTTSGQMNVTLKRPRGSTQCTPRITTLQYSRRYYYLLGEGSSAREFWFDTLPALGPDAAYTFGVIGDLGQSYDSATTLSHYLESQGEAVLNVGDLSYADEYPFFDGNRWDTFGCFAERGNAYHPWIYTAGNHEIEFDRSFGAVESFKAYSKRYKVPFEASDSISNLWYSIRRASSHIIVLPSNSPYVKYIEQNEWLQAEFKKVDRTITPWLIVLLHNAWYNSNTYHYLEGESMRVELEKWFVQYKVDIVYAGHVHSYERSYRFSNIRYNISNELCKPVPDDSAPVYVTIGDGGNLEGLAGLYIEPQPDYSAFREASFGHPILEIKNKTHAFHSWHRNQDGGGVHADSIWLYNGFWASNQ